MYFLHQFSVRGSKKVGSRLTNLLLLIFGILMMNSCKTTTIPATSSVVDTDTTTIGYGLVTECLVPVRGKPSDLEEMYTQLHRWEIIRIYSEKFPWLHINSEQSASAGWVDCKMITILQPEEYQQYVQLMGQGEYALVKLPVVYAYNQDTQQTLPLCAGTRLPHYHDGTFEVMGERYTIDPSQVLERPVPLTEENFQSIVTPFLNIPYLWAGTGGLGMDCSGFTQVIYSLFGHTLRRNSRLQSRMGTPVESFQDVQAGDLVFFGKDNNISHVGMMWDKHHVIHCSGRVRIDEINEQGYHHPVNGNIVPLICIRRL